MFHLAILSALLTLLTTTTLAVDQPIDPALNSRLITSPTQLCRHKDLPNDSDWSFNFTAQPHYTFSPGSVINANAATFPALTQIGMTLAMLNLGPCAMLPPHFHPRATNLVVAVTGETESFMVHENGARMVRATLTPGIMTVFPKGSLHMMANKGCTNAVLISALDSDDTGTTNIFNGAFNFPPEYVQAAFGNAGLDISTLGRTIPEVGTGSADGSAECLRRCAELKENGDRHH